RALPHGGLGRQRQDGGHTRKRRQSHHRFLPSYQNGSRSRRFSEPGRATIFSSSHSVCLNEYVSALRVEVITSSGTITNRPSRFIARLRWISSLAKKRSSNPPAFAKASRSGNSKQPAAQCTRLM